MRFNLNKKVRWFTLLVMTLGVLGSGPGMRAQTQTSRKVVKKVTPAIPALAVQLNLAGTVKLTAQVTPEGKVKSVHVTGGNAVLASSAENSVKQWIFEPAQKETSEAVEVVFVHP
jgi:TonB family protein